MLSRRLNSIDQKFMESGQAEVENPDVKDSSSLTGVEFEAPRPFYCWKEEILLVCTRELTSLRVVRGFFNNSNCWL